MVRDDKQTLFAFAAVLACAGSALGQEPPEGWGRDLFAEERHHSMEWVLRAPTTSAAILGGMGGAVVAAHGGGVWHEDLLVMRSGPSADAHLVYTFTEPDGEGPRLRRTVFELRADTIVGFVGVGQGSRGVTPRALYAEGSVRLVIRTPEGESVLECEQAYLDLVEEQAFLFEAEARGQSQSAPGKLAGVSPVIRARWLRVLGPHRVVGEDATATACDHGVPHAALAARRIELTRPLDAAEGPPRLLAGFLSGKQRRGSDAIGREATLPRDVHLRDVRLQLLGKELPFLPFVSWNTAWPLPTLRVGHSNRFGNYFRGGIQLELGQVELGPAGNLKLDGTTSVDYFEKRGTGGEAGLEWHREGESQGEGFFRAHYQRDRGDLDRVGTPVPTNDRFWLRGLAREELPLGVQLDAEVSKLSDRGYLLEYARDVAKTEKEQETYVNGRWSYDDFAAQLLARWRINDFQSQVERLPEAKLDWIKTPLWTHEWLGGFYLDASARAGQLRTRPEDATRLPSSGRVARADGSISLEYKVALGPVIARGFGTARETFWSHRVGADESIDRFLGEGGWNVATTIWSDFTTPWSVLRHELVPEVGMFHRFGVTRDPAELILFDADVEPLLPTDYLYLRLRTRFLTDVLGVRDKLVDFAVETRYFLRDRGADVGRSWGSIFYDLRLNLVSWFSARARAEQDVNGGGLISIDVSGTLRPWDGVEAVAAYRERPGVARALSYGISWQVTPAWAVAFEQQYDFFTDEFLYHRGRVVRSFHRFALQLQVSHDPQQDDTSVSLALSLAPLFSSQQGAFQQDRYRNLYE